MHVVGGVHGFVERHHKVNASLLEELGRLRHFFLEAPGDFQLPRGILDGLEEPLEGAVRENPSVIQTLFYSYGYDHELTVKLQLELIRRKGILMEPFPVERYRAVEFWKWHQGAKTYRPGVYVVDLVLHREQDLRQQLKNNKDPERMGGVEVLAAAALLEWDFIEKLKDLHFERVIAGGLLMRSDVHSKDQVVSIGIDQTMTSIWLDKEAGLATSALPIVSAVNCVRPFQRK